ncbi:MAG: two-component sensor histidine kinase [Proteobacteria bacterium]|nr:MAG: two-component sensor histidine kinase [Pseudomonadota bacterium]
MEDTKLAAAKNTKKPIFSGLINSLRWRQLISSLVIVATGIAGTGAVYYYFKNQAVLDAQSLEMERDAYKILSSIELSTNRKVIVLGDYVDEEVFGEYLKSRGFTQLMAERGITYNAYIQEVGGEGGIAWSHLHPNETQLNQASPYTTWKQRTFPTFLITPPLESDTPFIGMLKPSTAAGRNPSSQYSRYKNTEFTVYAKRFSLEDRLFQIILAKSTEGFEKDRQELARSIQALTLLSTLLVLIAQLVGSYIVLSPIRKIENEIKLIEAGEKDLIEHEYPSEINPVKSAINTLIHAEKGQKKRYRDALDNLAHALKTPLAALQSSSARSENGENVNQAYVDEQIQRMNDIVAYQLRRAVVSDHNAIVKLEHLRPIVFRLRESLLKVYYDKQFTLNINIDEYARCRVDYDDLMEVFGNLLNNACRFCESKIEVTATQDVDFLVVNIDDDGMGFPDNNPSQLLKRGMRADSKTEGQGIGLAVSAEIIENAGGKITLLMSPFIGARVRLHLPV